MIRAASVEDAGVMARLSGQLGYPAVLSEAVGE